MTQIQYRSMSAISLILAIGLLAFAMPHSSALDRLSDLTDYLVPMCVFFLSIALFLIGQNADGKSGKQLTIQLNIALTLCLLGLSHILLHL